MMLPIAELSAEVTVAVVTTIINGALGGLALFYFRKYKPMKRESDSADAKARADSALEEQRAASTFWQGQYEWQLARDEERRQRVEAQLNSLQDKFDKASVDHIKAREDVARLTAEKAALEARIQLLQSRGQP